LEAIIILKEENNNNTIFVNDVKVQLLWLLRSSKSYIGEWWN